MFDKTTDQIAIFLTHLRILKSFDPVSQYLHPYIVAIVTDKKDGKLAMQYKYFEFPQSKVYQPIIKAENGLLLYGPDNPGELVAINLMLFDSDKNIQQVGSFIENVMDKASKDLNVLVELAKDPVASAITALAEDVLNVIADALKSNEDDPIMYVYDTFLQGLNPPYKINQYKLHSGPAAEMTLSVYPIADEAKNSWKKIA